MTRTNTKGAIETIARALKKAFSLADCPDDIEPVFREAAEGEGESGGGWHGWAPIGLPGAKFHAMTGQMEKSHDVRRARAEARGFRDTVLDRADYYGSFDKINNFKM